MILPDIVRLSDCDLGQLVCDPATGILARVVSRDDKRDRVYLSIPRQPGTEDTVRGVDRYTKVEKIPAWREKEAFEHVGIEVGRLRWYHA
jgi:hypothetical protein